MDTSREEAEIVIVGGGISGLATALALHRKGIRSLVLERSESLRAAGAGIAVLGNGWRALDHLGVASKLRQKSVPLQRVRDIMLDSGKERESPVSYGECRCVQRSELIKALADDLPPGTIRFGCQIVSVKLDSLSSFPITELQNGDTIMSKVLIGCDGSNSVISDFLGLKPKKVFPMCAVRGFTNYPNGHSFPPQLLRIRSGNTLCGRAPINDNLVFWFLVQQSFPDRDSSIWKDPEQIRQMSVDTVREFPSEVKEMMNNGDLTSLSLTHLRYRAPWDVFRGRFWKGTVTVAGDAMHVMGPFLGQGGSSGMEDAVVLGRCLGEKMLRVQVDVMGQEEIVREEIGEALGQFVRERRMRLLRLSAQTFLTGTLLGTKSLVLKGVIVLMFLVFFRDPIGHTKYDCGHL